MLNLKEALKAFLDHRKEVVTRRTAYDLRKAEERLHILEGLKIALDHLDAVITLIRRSQDPQGCKRRLDAEFRALSEIQAQAILDMRLQRLTGLERDKIWKSTGKRWSSSPSSGRSSPTRRKSTASLSKS